MSQFDAATYGGQEVGFGSRPAVLVVDFQCGFTDPAYPIGRSEHVAGAVDNTIRLLDVAKRCNVPVASCRTAWKNADDMSYWKIPALYDGSFFYGHPATEIDPRISDPDYHFEFLKTAPSIFFRTPLATWLTKLGIDTTIITGCTTSGCVRASIVDAFSHGYRVIVPEECCGDQEADAHEDNLRDCGRRYADVVTLDYVVQHLEQHHGQKASA